MSRSTRKVYLWCSIIAATILAAVALSASAQTFAHSPMSERDTASTIVTPGRETTLTSPDGRVTIIFPADFFTETLVVTYTERAITDLPTNLVQVGPAFTLEAMRAGDGQPVIIYEMDGCPGVRGEPAGKDQCNATPDGGFEITFRYSDGEMASSGVDEDRFALAYYYTPDGTHGKWLPLTTVIDGSGHQAIASTWYLAHFALLGVAPSSPPAGAGQVEVIVDDLDDEFIRYQAPGCEDYWWHYWSEGGTYEGHSYYTKDSDETHGRENWGEWTPDLPESATYEVFAFIPWNHATTESAHYSIERDGVQIGTVTINQLDIYAEWVSLGSYSLPAGRRSKVVLDDMTDDPGYAGRDIGFDALKFVCLDCGATPTATPNPTVTPSPTPEAFRINSVAVVDESGTVLDWDALVMSDDELIVEARGTGDNPPDHVWAQVKALQSGRKTVIQLMFSHTTGGTHVYRGTHAAAQLVSKPSALTVAAVVWDWNPSETDYEIAQEFMDNLGIPENRRRGIAWGDGDETKNRPPANLDYFRAAGYETAKVSALYYPDATTDEFFIQNQADVLFYLGHGAHEANYVHLSGSDEGGPSDIDRDDAWDKGLQTVIFFACSVLDINNYDGCADDDKSPGKEWIKLAGPQTWIGFKWTAPTAVQGRSQLQKFATEYVSSGDWIAAWQTATGENITAFRHAVAIDSSNYYYWDCPISINLPGTGCKCGGTPTWETVPLADLDSSGQGLEILVASPVEVHVYDRQGRHVGPDGHGGIETEIPGSAYWTPIVAGEPQPDARRVSIPAGDLSHGYRVELVGVGDGEFDFYLEIPDRATGVLYHADYLSVTVAVADEFALTLERGTDFVLAADRDGDGVFEGRVAPSSVSSREMEMPVNLVLEGTAGENGWYKSDVVATLRGSTRPDLPPLAGLEYDLGSGWRTYTTPLRLTQEGTHTLQYRGTFEGGGQDVTQWVNIRLDKRPPTLTLTSPTAITYTLCPYTGTTYGGAFTVTYRAEDAVSGLQTVGAVLDGETIANGQVLETLYLAPGPHELVVRARDRAGWQTVRRQPIFVQTQIEDLRSAVTRLGELGLISGPGASEVITALQARLSAAQGARDGGDVAAAVGYLHTFVRDVEEQFPAPIGAEAARILIRGAQYVANRLAGEIAVSPAFGGRLSSSDFRVTVRFPAGAVETLSVATYRTLTATPPITLPRFSPVFALEAYEYDTGEPVTDFQRPVTITVQYGDGGVEGLGERWLALHVWDETNEAWGMIPTVIDVAQDRAEAQVEHFSAYALLEREHSIVFLPLVTRE